MNEKEEKLSQIAKATFRDKLDDLTKLEIKSTVQKISKELVSGINLFRERLQELGSVNMNFTYFLTKPRMQTDNERKYDFYPR